MTNLMNNGHVKSPVNHTAPQSGLKQTLCHAYESSRTEGAVGQHRLTVFDDPLCHIAMAVAGLVQRSEAKG